MRGREKSSVRDFAARLAVLDLDQPSSLEWLVPALRERFDLRFGLAYRAGRVSDGWNLEFSVADGVDPATVKCELVKAVRNSAWGAYDPVKPQPSQRNVVVRILDMVPAEAYAQMPGHQGYCRVGLYGEEVDETRALICDGDLLLSWLGGTHVGPLPAKDRQFFKRLIPHIQHRLIAERALSTRGLLERGLEAAMGEIERDAFLVDEKGVVQYANARGRERPPSELRALAEEVRHAGEPGRSFRATQIRAEGCGDHYLLVRRPPNAEADLVARAAREWELTPRQTDVLRCIVRGDANKTIAERLGCALGTVEVHVSALLVKARVDSRTALVARLLKD